MNYPVGMTPGRQRAAATMALLLGLVAWLSAQSAPLTATLATIERYPTFFQGRTVALVGTPSLAEGFWRLPLTGPKTLVVLPRTGTPPMSRVELRGQLFDVGRFDSGDSRLSASGMRHVIETLHPNGWPVRNSLFILADATWRDDEPAASSIRAVVLHPETFEGSRVTLRGKFRAQNLYGDLPAWPRKSEWDFVLQAADGSIWVTGLRPRGQRFDLDPKVRRGAGTWLEVTGTIRLIDDLPTLAAQAIAPSSAADEPVTDPASNALGPPEIPAVIFSVPLDGERGVNPAAPVRIQFSRNMTATSFEGAVRLTYGEGVSAQIPAFTTKYLAHIRALEITFASPLAPDTDVVVQLAETIRAVDDAALVSVTIRFRTK